MTEAVIEPEAPAVQYWTGPLVVEGVPTGDKRRVMPDALTWRDLPQPLMFQRQTPEGRGNPHAGASLAGRITTLWREDGTIHGAGPIDTGTDGADLARFMADGPIGVSVDMDDVDAEMTCLEEDEMGECSSAEMQIVKARIMGATACAFPAIPEASISLISPEEYAALTTAHEPTMALATQVEEHDFEDSGDGTCAICGGTLEEHNALMAEMALVAAGGPLLPPESWFEDPGLAGWTPLQITDDGRVFGHMARWGQKHTGQAGRTPPKSATGYAYFKVGSRLASCECPDRGGKVEVATGTITLGTHHDYDFSHSPSEVIGHYDHTGYAVADINAGEDAIGIWVAGALRPDVSEERIIELRGGGLSGDWRFIGGRLEMVAALVVNQPGFPIPKTTWHEREGKVTALVAAGVAVSAPWVPTQEWVLANQAQTEALETRLGLAEARLARHAQSLAALRPLILDGLKARFGD